MTAIQAQFVKMIPVPSRKMAQLVCEVPEEHADKALAALGGWPTAAKAQWVAIAPITHEAASQPAPQPEKRRFADMSRAAQAGILCQSEPFMDFLAEREGEPEFDETGAAWYVRDYCKVKSRSELNEPTRATAHKAWDTLLTEYDAWRGRIGKPE